MEETTGQNGGFTLILLAVIFIICIILGKRHDRMIKRKESEAKLARQLELDIKKHLLEETINQLTNKYGECAVDILLSPKDDYDIKDRLLVFEKTSTVFLNGKEMPFEKIIGVQLLDNSTMIYETHSSTSSNDALDNSIIGGMFGGTTGAIIGAAASKSTTISHSESRTSHDYYLHINIDDLTNPTLIIALGEDTQKAIHLLHLFNVIIKRNTNS